MLVSSAAGRALSSSCLARRLTVRPLQQHAGTHRCDYHTTLHRLQSQQPQQQPQRSALTPRQHRINANYQQPPTQSPSHSTPPPAHSAPLTTQQPLTIYRNNQTGKIRTRFGFIGINALCTPWFFYLAHVGDMAYTVPSAVIVLLAGAMLGANTIAGHTVHQIQCNDPQGAPRRLPTSYTITTYTAIGRLQHRDVTVNDIHHGRLTYSTATAGGLYKFKVGNDRMFHVVEAPDDRNTKNADREFQLDVDMLSRFLRYDVCGSIVNGTQFTKAMVNR